MKWMLAVDITDAQPERLIDEAVRWASRAGAVLDLVHIEGARYAYEFVNDPYVRDLMAAEASKMRKEDERRLFALRDSIPEAHRGVAKLMAGRPVSAIVDASKGYDGVLVGTHGRTGMAHFWLGSVAEQVVRRCEVPVLVLRIPKAA